MCAGLLPFLLLVAGLANAQAPPDQDLMSLSIEDLAKTKVFTASRHLENTREAPSSVSIITSEDIARYGWRTLGDILGSLRGFYTSYDRDYTYLGVRGIQRPGDYNSRILLMINGHRLNDNVYDSAPIGSEFPLDLDLIDHIEIVRGPSSSLFGTNAVFGIINVITRRPKGGTAIEVSGDEGSFLSRSGRLTGSYQKGLLSALLSGSMYRSAGVSDLFYPEFVETNSGIAENIDGEHYEYAFADVQYGELRVQGQFGTRTKIIPTAPYGTIFNDPETRGTDTGGYVDVSDHRRLSSATDLDLRAQYDEYSYAGTGGFLQGGDVDRLLTTARADSIGFEANLEQRIGRQRITVGADYEYSLRVNQKNIMLGQPPSFNDTRTPWFVATYGEAELNFIPKLTFRLGGRLDWFDSFGTALSPRAAVIYQPNSRTSLKYIFARAFRAPNAYEDYYTDGVSVVAPTKPLEPEHIGSHEVVFERSLKSWLGITADGFYNNLSNLIDEVPDPVSGLNHFVNIGHDEGRGVEFELEAKRESGLSARASYTFSAAQDKTQHVSLGNSPTNTVKLHSTIPASHRAFAGLELLYTSPQTSYQGTQIPSWFLTNVTFSTKPLWGGWEFAASCYNTFNQSWYAPAGPGLEQAAIQQDGRTYRFKISYRLPIKEARSKEGRSK
jgi:iron complex outermembrane receptor protein